MTKIEEFLELIEDSLADQGMSPAAAEVARINMQHLRAVVRSAVDLAEARNLTSDVAFRHKVVDAVLAWQRLP